MYCLVLESQLLGDMSGKTGMIQMIRVPRLGVLSMRRIVWANGRWDRRGELGDRKARETNWFQFWFHSFQKSMGDVKAGLRTF